MVNRRYKIIRRFRMQYRTKTNDWIVCIVFNQGEVILDWVFPNENLTEVKKCIRFFSDDIDGVRSHMVFPDITFYYKNYVSATLNGYKLITRTIF